MSGPAARSASSPCPPGQDPDDLIRAGGRAALEALLETPEPLVDRLWRHERDAEPLATPEQRAGPAAPADATMSSAIGDPDVRDQYRAELLGRFDALTRAAAARHGRRSRPARRPGGALRRRRRARFGRRRKAVGSAGLEPAAGPRGAARACSVFPTLIADHAEAIAALAAAPTATPPRLRDRAARSGDDARRA